MSLTASIGLLQSVVLLALILVDAAECLRHSDDGDVTGRYAVWFHRVKRSAAAEGSNSNKTGSEHSERYKVASMDWKRVANPFVVCMWIMFAGLAKIGFRAHYMHKIVSRVPESCLLICLGLIVGGIAYAIDKDHQIDKLLFNPDTFFLFILPPIVLEAGYFMPKEPFFDNLGTILTFAIIGTLFNAMCIGASLYGVFKAGLMPGMMNISIYECLLFGSIISAVDPVAVISVFEEIHVNIVLYICVFGESLLNDGVAVVLYHLFEQYLELDEILPIDIAAAILSFLVVVGGGLALGIIFGYTGSFITKYTVHNRIIEPTFVFVTCYLAYLTAEIFHLSGIIAIVFAGFVMNSYVEHNISAKSHTTVKYGMKMLAGVCETIIFMLLGIAAVSDFWQHWNTGFVVWTLVFITVYRAIGVVVLTRFLNYFRLDKINGVDQFVMAYGGLRGAIAFSLVSLTSAETVPAIKTMVCACIMCILFTSFVQGSTIRPIVDLLHVKTASEHKETMFEDINMRLIDHLMAGIEDVIGHRGHHYWTQRFVRFNTDYLMKWFVREPYRTHDQVILETFHRINKREAQDMLLEIERGASHNEMYSEKTLANLLIPTDMRRSYSTTSFSSMVTTNSDACLDMRAIEMQRQSAQVIADDEVADAHHMLRKNMYRPRVKIQPQYRRGQIEVDHVQRRQEQEILIRRRIHQRRKKHQKHKKHQRHGKPGDPRLGHFTKYSRNGSGSIVRMAGHSNTEEQGPVCIQEQTINPLTGIVAPSVMIDSGSPRTSVVDVIKEDDEEDAGITFTVTKAQDDVDGGEKSPDKQVALQKVLPWRTQDTSAGICDPHDRYGSIPPIPQFVDENENEHLDESDRGSMPGTSNNNSNNNTERKRLSASASNSEAVAPKDVFLREPPAEDSSDEDQGDATDVQTVPLLFMAGQSSRDDDSIQWGEMKEDEI